MVYICVCVCVAKYIWYIYSSLIYYLSLHVLSSTFSIYMWLNFCTKSTLWWDMVIHDILLHEYIIPRGRVIWYKHFRKTFILSSASEHTLSNFTSGRDQIFKERSAPCPKSHGPSGSMHCFGRYWKIWKHWKILEDLEALEDIQIPPISLYTPFMVFLKNL